jgi:hypothetical protein
VLEAELAKVEVLAAGHRADFERERERFDGVMAELLRSTMDASQRKKQLPGLKANSLCGAGHSGIG